MDFEKIIAHSPNPEAAIRAAYKLELCEEMIRLTNELERDIAKLNTKAGVL